MKKTLILLSSLLFLTNCSKDDNNTTPEPDSGMYFPPVSGINWETTSPSELGWNETALQPLKDYLAEKNTKSFIILVNGRIVVEEYFDGQTAADTWEWNSAGKTLVGTTTGLAQEDGFLNIDAQVSDYLGEGWTNMTLEKEDLITPWHLLTMTSGIDDTKQLVVKDNLTYLADAGTRWAYGNVFQKLIDVVAEAGNQEFEAYFNTRLKNRIGMDGFWNYGAIFTIYHSTARSMARFGLLALNNGNWDGDQVVNESFFIDSHNTSQDINTSYGYFWWLNGKSVFMLPGGQEQYTGPLVPNAPLDMFAGMGALDQRVYVVPSRNMVVIRMGNAADPANPAFAISGFDNELWARISAVTD
ncbi:CubicO group peptidase, beta-lactamase class C family [Muriicola jejuensis]|uniref:Serine hydrolase n=1 Tax=Muriicola jejuensis TaxID=504488 RepID=A0A6P0UAC1_9FLAO|nr:serine hydrolase [Muriicola jejuensis]NER10165.1 serine hydrolase [Muriicola jejuensis]SMP02604.1 CubicO group peptidase, beta-lactamase class C family [Muriicola jejuensis]